MSVYPLETFSAGNEMIAYRRAGAGDPVLLIHGNLCSSVHWIPTLEKLSKTHDVIVPDMRGFGESTYANKIETLRDLALDLEKLVDGLGIGPFKVAGWSTGGGVAMEMAADLERITGLVLIDSVPPTGYLMYKKDENRKPIYSQPITTYEEMEADPVQVQIPLKALRTGNKAIMRRVFENSIYNIVIPPEEEYEANISATMLQRNLLEIDYALLTFDMVKSGRLDKIKCPIHMIHGAKDKLIPLEWALKAKDLLGDRATLHVFENAGHSVLTDDPDAFFAALAEALK
ncbi:MAG: alpha/beta hydrolase [Clostridiales bacterium]|jgi:pimeloyl-ACP methyl ester carboxylesterase|nr:alpha/beta hydrolase [Clostridiales bacterium]